MYIKKVEITNIRSIREFSMTFGNPAGWHVLIGDNGTGKSTIIRSIALALIGTEQALGLRTDWREWLNNQTSEGTVKLKISRDKVDASIYTEGAKKSRLRAIFNELYFKRDSNGVSFSGNNSGAEDTNPTFYNWGNGNGWFSAGYGPFRRFSGGSTEMSKIFNNPDLTRLASHLSLFGEDVALTEVTEWLTRLDYKRLETAPSDVTAVAIRLLTSLLGQSDDIETDTIKMLSVAASNVAGALGYNAVLGTDSTREELLASLKKELAYLEQYQLVRPPSSDLIGGLKTLINSKGFLPHQTKLTRISSEGIVFTDGNGARISIEQMSDGYRSILSLTFELIRQMVRVYGDEAVSRSISIGKGAIGLPGVVLVDEIDAHLHPTWQTSIGQWFTKYFPQLQFIVTTHSPLVCRACERGSIWRLAAPGSDGESGEVTGTERDRLIFGNVLDAFGTEVFGANVTINPESVEKKEELVELNKKKMAGVINAAEESKLEQLRKTFTTDDPIDL